MSSLTTTEARQAASAQRKKRITAFMFVVPLLVFILLTFVAPIASMLWRSVHHPTVAELIPHTLEALKDWDGKAVPDQHTLQIFAVELNGLAKERLSGKLAEEFNRAYTGMSSVVKSTARKVAKLKGDDLRDKGAQTLLDANPKWQRTDLWYAIQRAGEKYTYDYYLTALDLELKPDTGIQVREETQIYLQLYSKTLTMALVITLLCAALGYPLSYYLAGLSENRANLLLVLVLLPFWTSLLVRTTAWIALLQTNGVINSFLMGVGLTNEPFEMLYTSFATVVAMTHILLPFMILPLYSVMRGIDPSYMRAALSLGDKPIPAFAKIYLPMTLPGLSAGALLVFIISVGYYITPALVGGTDGQMISNIIAFHMQRSNNWELAAALGSLLLALILLLYWLYDRFVGASNIKLG
ncbi:MULTISPECIES: ABC transporter permease [Pseudomonas]|uniref:Putative spermidine/putrescine transport system permease protein n=1 Tax=Pseudomonas segetis TaxID=298908 RepID=A0A239G5Z6_9PSED|nr:MULTISPECIES: ABC transporter permease [Pseudomonas]SNS64198.1 putative spermidine/putrescine transport system permease protein [Pseudomonas segetis]